MVKQPLEPKQEREHIMAKSTTVNKAKAPKMAQATTNQALAYVSPKALSVDVGEKAVKAFMATKQTDEKISELTNQNLQQKGQTLAMLTKAFVNAALNDKNIKLEIARLDDQKGKEASDLRQRLEVAVGIKHAQRGEDGVEKITYTPWTAKYFPQTGEDKKIGVGRQKENFRSNFAAIFTKAIRAALAIKDRGITMNEDAQTGTLLLSGKAIKERFNVDQVALNEKQTVQVGDQVVKLPKIPSFTELGRMALEGTGKELKTRVDSRAKVINSANESDVLSGIRSLTMTLGKLTKFSDETAAALDDLITACEAALDANKAEDEPDAA